MMTLLLAAVAQTAVPAPPPVPAPGVGDRSVVHEIVIHRQPGDKSAAADPKGKEERREFILIREGNASASRDAPERRIRIVDTQPGAPGDRREVRILREPGAAGARVAMLNCDNGSKVDSEATDKDGKKTRVMVCAKGGNQVEALERASKRIAENKDISEDVRSKVLAQMNAEIARLKSGK